MNTLDEALSRLSATVAEAKASARHSRETALLVALRAWMDCRSTPAWLKSPDLREMLYINPAYTEKFGITYPGYGGQPDSAVWDDDTAAAFCKNDLRVLAANTEMEFIEDVGGIMYRVRKWPAAIDGVVLGVAGECLEPVNAGH